MLGILLVDKPAGRTSHDVVDVLRRRFGVRRVGHAGTLDPLARGLLVAAVGPATRFLRYLDLEPKVYEAEVEFGRATDTYDAEGETTSTAAPPSELSEALTAALPAFLGVIEQLPPMHSAVKVAGRPLYRYAREGTEVEVRPRSVEIRSIELLGVDGARARLRIACGGGTYVRSLAHDLGARLGCGAYLADLVRTAAGRFDLEGAVAPEQAGSELLLPLAEALRPMPMVELGAEAEARARTGRSVEAGPESPGDGPVAMLDAAGAVFAVARSEGGVLRPECVLPTVEVSRA